MSSVVNTTAVPSTGVVKLSDIRKALPGASSTLAGYKGKHPSLPTSGTVRMTQFKGLNADSPAITLTAVTGTGMQLSQSGAITGTSGGALSINLLNSVTNAAYQGQITWTVSNGTLPTNATLGNLTGQLDFSNTPATTSSVTIRATNAYLNYTEVALTLSILGANMGRVATVSAGGRIVSAAVDTTGGVHTWGKNYNGAIGDGSANQTVRSSPVSIKNSGSLSGVTITAVSCGDGHAVALSSTGILHAWGNNSYGQIGDGTVTTFNPDYSINVDNSRYTPVSLSGKGSLAFSGGIAKIGCGANHTIAVDASGYCHGWGRNTYGELADGSTTNRSQPTYLGFSSKVKLLAVGYMFTVVVTQNTGDLYTWGLLPDSTSTNGSSTALTYYQSSFGSLGGGKVISDLAAGSFHVVALESTGVLHAWGTNNYGQLGDGSTTFRTNAVSLATSGSLSGKTIKGVVCGSYHTIAIDSNGALHAFGANSGGELGLGTSTAGVSTPVVTSTGSIVGKSILGIASGNYADRSYAVDSNGALYAWGYNNSDGILGDGSASSRWSPVSLASSGSIAGNAIKTT